MMHDAKAGVSGDKRSAGPSMSLRHLFAGLVLGIGLGAMAILSAAVRVAAAPLPGAIVTHSPTEVAVDFEVPLDPQFVKLEILDERGADYAIGPPRVSVDRKRLSVRVESLRPGAFVVQWGVVDHRGNLSEGTFTFMVKLPDTLASSF